MRSLPFRRRARASRRGRTRLLVCSLMMGICFGCRSGDEGADKDSLARAGFVYEGMHVDFRKDITLIG